MEKSINQKFNILMAIGMIAVVGQHTGFIFFEWLGNAFHIPLFFFISGYFFHDKPFWEFFKKKIMHLIIPFLLWNAFYGIVINLLTAYGLTALFHQEVTLKSLFWDPFTMGWQFWFNAASWFVGVLFPVQILYWSLLKLAKENYKLLGMILVLLHIVSLWMVFHGYTKISYNGLFTNIGLAISRILYSTIFYYVGHVYRLYLEDQDKFSLKKIVGVFLCNAVIIGCVSKNITIVVNTMEFPKHNYWIPFVLSIGGIWVCVQVSEILSKIYISNRMSLIDYIGRHSWDIMMHQFMFFWLINTVLWYMNIFELINIESFDYNKYMHNIYYRINLYPPLNRLIYFIAGLIGPLVFCYIYEKYIEHYIMAITNTIRKKLIKLFVYK